MPKVSKQTVESIQDYGMAEDRTAELDGYTVNFVTIKETHSLAPMLQALPDGKCPCPHWGYLLNGRVTVRYGDHDEDYEAGDAFYMSPGHVPEAEAGSEFVLFSPADQLAEVEAAISAAMQSGAN